jgi:hypothetical protein
MMEIPQTRTRAGMADPSGEREICRFYVEREVRACLVQVSAICLGVLVVFCKSGLPGGKVAHAALRKGVRTCGCRLAA